MVFDEMGFLDDFRTFLMQGNVIDLAVAVVIGVAFTAVVTAFVADIITPLIGVAGKFDFSSITYTVNNSTFLVGSFINALISFILIALVVFFLIVKPASKLKKKQESTTKTCPHCLQSIPLKAKRCMYCTSKVR